MANHYTLGTVLYFLYFIEKLQIGEVMPMIESLQIPRGISMFLLIIFNKEIAGAP